MQLLQLMVLKNVMYRRKVQWISNPFSFSVFKQAVVTSYVRRCQLGNRRFSKPKQFPLPGSCCPGTKGVKLFAISGDFTKKYAFCLFFVLMTFKGCSITAAAIVLLFKMMPITILKESCGTFQQQQVYNIQML